MTQCLDAQSSLPWGIAQFARRRPRDGQPGSKSITSRRATCAWIYQSRARNAAQWRFQCCTGITGVTFAVCATIRPAPLASHPSAIRWGSGHRIQAGAEGGKDGRIFVTATSARGPADWDIGRAPGGRSRADPDGASVASSAQRRIEESRPPRIACSVRHRRGRTAERVRTSAQRRPPASPARVHLELADSGRHSPSPTARSR